MGAVILALCPNPCWDITVHTDSFAIGQSIRATSTHSRPGGKGINVARVVQLLGHHALSLFPLNPVDSDFASSLSKSGCSVQAVPVNRLVRRSVTITTPSETTTFNEPGSELTRKECEKFVSQVSSHMPKVRAVTLSGSVPEGWTADTTADIATLAKRNKIPLVLDTHSHDIKPALKIGVALVKVNAEEAAQIANMSVTNAKDAEKAAKAMQQLGAHDVLITLGESGALLRTEDATYMASVPAISGNPTGAGDSVAAVMAIGLGEGRSTLSSIIPAMAAGCATVKSPVAGEFDLVDFENLKQQIEIKEIA